MRQLIGRPVQALLGAPKTGEQPVQVGGRRDNPCAIGRAAEVEGAAKRHGFRGVVSAAHRETLQLEAGCREADQVGNAVGDVHRRLGRQVSRSHLFHTMETGHSAWGTLLFAQFPSLNAPATSNDSRVLLLTTANSCLQTHA